MSSTIKTLAKQGLITPPGFLADNVHYETMMGSVAYGVSGGNSDVDVYGFCIPPKDWIFPHLRGEIPGFGRQVNRFEQYQQHHVESKDTKKVYDLAIYSIVKYFQLCMENNPNMIDSLFVPQFCILHITKIGNMVRENRKLFLHKGSWHKFKGYAYSQLHKMSTKVATPGSNRDAICQQFGFDVKFGYHVVRLLDEAEQILTTGDINLQRNKEHLKAIRNGEVTEGDLRKWASDKEIALEKAYDNSSLRHSPPETEIKRLLLACLEEHYGSLDQCLIEEDWAIKALQDVQEVLSKHRSRL